MILSREVFWECPNCEVKDRTTEANPHTRFHSCRGLFGLTTPLVQQGTKCKVTANEREDYINGEDVQLDGRGRPVMNVITEREDGTDCTVYAPSVSAKEVK